MTAPITLFIDRHWISPYVFSCFIALHEKKLAFDTEVVSLHEGAHRNPAYRDPSITGRVPALRHGNFWVAESSAIVEYLEDTFPTPRVLPANVEERARARQVMAFVRSDLMPIRDERPTTTLFYERTIRPFSEEGLAAAERLIRTASLLLPDGRTSLFSSFSIADTDLALMLQRLAMNGHEIGPRLSAFVDTQWARPSVRAFVAKERPTYEGP